MDGPCFSEAVAAARALAAATRLSTTAATRREVDLLRGASSRPPLLTGAGAGSKASCRPGLPGPRETGFIASWFPCRSTHKQTSVHLDSLEHNRLFVPKRKLNKLVLLLSCYPRRPLYSCGEFPGRLLIFQS